MLSISKFVTQMKSIPDRPFGQFGASKFEASKSGDRRMICFLRRIENLQGCEKVRREFYMSHCDQSRTTWSCQRPNETRQLGFNLFIPKTIMK